MIFHSLAASHPRLRWQISHAQIYKSSGGHTRTSAPPEGGFFSNPSWISTFHSFVFDIDLQKAHYHQWFLLTFKLFGRNPSVGSICWFSGKQSPQKESLGSIWFIWFFPFQQRGDFHVIQPSVFKGVPGTQRPFFFIGMEMVKVISTHFSCKDLESSNWKFVDVWGCLGSFSPILVYFLLYMLRFGVVVVRQF